MKNPFATSRRAMRVLAGVGLSCALLLVWQHSFNGFGRDHDTQFHWVSLDQLQSTLYSSQGNYIYFDGVRFPGADTSSFLVAVDASGRISPYAKDRYRVYYLPFGYVGADWHVTLSTIMVITGADPGTFSVIYSLPAQDILQTADPEYLYQRYARDKSAVFYQGYPITGADPRTFEIVRNRDGYPTNFDVDAMHVYFDDYAPGTSLTLSDVDRSSFRYIGSNYIADGEHVFDSAGVVLSDDPADFKLVEPPGSCGSGCEYDAYDRTAVYFLGSKVGAPPAVWN